jgi:hypothetical protein
MNLHISGLPALIIEVGFIVVFAAPVWLGARIVRAAHPTLIRSILSLVAGTIGAVLSIAFTGGYAVLLAPLSFLLTFKFILGTSMLGAIGLAVVALAGYAVMVHFIGAGFQFTGGGSGTAV